MEYELNDNAEHDPRLYAIPDTHGHAKGEHKAFSDERPIPLSARMLFLWFFHACRRGWPRFLMVSDHMNYLTFEDPAAINLVRRALKLAQAGDLYGAAETASVEVGHAAVVSEGLRRGMRYSIGAEVDNDPRCRPDAQNIVDAMKPDGTIRSVHFLTIDHPVHGPNWNWPFDNPEFADVHELVGTERTWELYMATLLDALERLPGNIVGHFYVPAIFGHWPDDATLEAYEDRLLDICETRGLAIEFNTRFLYRRHTDEERERYLAAHRRLLRKARVRNVGIAVGSDAHSPKDQGRAFETVLALLDECEINEVVFPIAGRLARVALRIERKLEAVAPADVPASVADERKAPRKARPSEAPARNRETSSKREGMSEADDSVPAADAPPSSRTRSKRPKKPPALDLHPDDEPQSASLAAVDPLDVTVDGARINPGATPIDEVSGEQVIVGVLTVDDPTPNEAGLRNVAAADPVVNEPAAADSNVTETGGSETAVNDAAVNDPVVNDAAEDLNDAEVDSADMNDTEVDAGIDETVGLGTRTAHDAATGDGTSKVDLTVDGVPVGDISLDDVPIDEASVDEVALDELLHPESDALDGGRESEATAVAREADARITEREQADAVKDDPQVAADERSIAPSSDERLAKRRPASAPKPAAPKSKSPARSAKPSATAKSSAKKTAPAAKKAPAKAAAAKKAGAKKAASKKPAVRKPAARPAAKAAAAKKGGAKKSAAKKPARKRR